MSGSLEMMKITGYKDEGFSSELPGNPYTVMMNPTDIKWDGSIEYSEQAIPDSSAPSQKYKNTSPKSLSVKINIDCTGIVDITRVNMETEISSIQTIVYDYNGDIHRPNFVKVQWGKNFIFKGVLTSMSVSYNLFKPDGSPLRAVVNLDFASYVSAATAEQQDKKNSPDLTHLVDVVEGDTLPQLCDKTWEDSSYYIKVAEFNKLNKFRQLTGGQQLVFPPIIQPN